MKSKACADKGVCAGRRRRRNAVHSKPRACSQQWHAQHERSATAAGLVYVCMCKWCLVEELCVYVRWQNESQCCKIASPLTRLRPWPTPSWHCPPSAPWRAHVSAAPSLWPLPSRDTNAAQGSADCCICIRGVQGTDASCCSHIQWAHACVAGPPALGGAACQHAHLHADAAAFSLGHLLIRMHAAPVKT